LPEIEGHAALALVACILVAWSRTRTVLDPQVAASSGLACTCAAGALRYCRGLGRLSAWLALGVLALSAAAIVAGMATPDLARTAIWAIRSLVTRSLLRAMA
jgi:hypothetical protein